jgi:hypothetical protein
MRPKHAHLCFEAGQVANILDLRQTGTEPAIDVAAILKATRVDAGAVGVRAKGKSPNGAELRVGNRAGAGRKAYCESCRADRSVE